MANFVAFTATRAGFGVVLKVFILLVQGRSVYSFEAFRPLIFVDH